LATFTVPKDWRAKRLMSGVRPSLEASVTSSWLALGPYSGFSGSIGVFTSRMAARPSTWPSPKRSPPSQISLTSCSNGIVFHWPEPRGPTRLSGASTRCAAVWCSNMAEPRAQLVARPFRALSPPGWA